MGKDLTTNSEVVNYNTRILGRGGVMSAVLIADPRVLTAATDDFKSTLPGFTYLPGQRYAEYKPGDKVAKYGLAALVAGGAAAIAVKTGFWKVIVGAAIAGWKFVVEPPRLSRRPHNLRGWGNGNIKAVFSGSSAACGADGGGAPA